MKFHVPCLGNCLSVLFHPCVKYAKECRTQQVTLLFYGLKGQISRRIHKLKTFTLKNAVWFFVKRKGIISMEFITYINSVVDKKERQKRKIKRLPMRSTVTEFPSTSEKPNNTQGNKGALNVNKPKKFIRTKRFLRLQMYTSIMVNAWPRNTKLTNSAITLNTRGKEK